MPITLARIFKVTSCRTANPNVQQHWIDAETVEMPPRLEQFVTVNDLRASLCQEVAGTTALVWLTWRDGRARTKDIVHAELKNGAQP
jgi:hypothetical protein